MAKFLLMVFHFPQVKDQNVVIIMFIGKVMTKLENEYEGGLIKSLWARAKQ